MVINVGLYVACLLSLYVLNTTNLRPEHDQAEVIRAFSEER